ncbi:hypothetical protein, partial [Acinetobacter baumannii]|uniref:hypothetical protein n=1 Tax=Acinetobacter baumannii TaxID=470 RepID=UPI001C0680A1
NDLSYTLTHQFIRKIEIYFLKTIGFLFCLILLVSMILCNNSLLIDFPYKKTPQPLLRLGCLE